MAETPSLSRNNSNCCPSPIALEKKNSIGSGSSGFSKVLTDNLKKGRTIINNYYINNNF